MEDDIHSECIKKMDTMKGEMANMKGEMLGIINSLILVIQTLVPDRSELVLKDVTEKLKKFEK